MKFPGAEQKLKKIITIKKMGTLEWSRVYV